MARTKPVVPKNEKPIDEDLARRILDNVSEDMILVGGQALAFWMDRFKIGPRNSGDHLKFTDVSTDIDFLGTIQGAQSLARSLNAKWIPGAPSELSSLLGAIHIPAEKDLIQNIDVLHLVYSVGGLKKSVEFTKRVQGRAVSFRINEEHIIKVLHPIDVLTSRIHNVAGLYDSKGEHVVTQAEWAIQVAKIVLEKLTSSDRKSPERPGAIAGEIFRLAMSKAGRDAHKKHGIEVMESIPFDLMIRDIEGFKQQAERMTSSLKERGRLLDFVLPKNFQRER